MKKIVFSLIAFTMTTVSAFAGGILTNTNQSISFLKNPARDAAIGLDGDPDLIPGSGRSAGEGIGYPLQYSWAPLVAQLVKNPSAMQET